MTRLLAEFKPNDRYSVKEGLRLRGQKIIDYYANKNDDEIHDMGSKTLTDFRQLGIAEDVLRAAICLFYRDHPETIDSLRESIEGRDYLRYLENQA